jgi:hypothetical protein
MGRVPEQAGAATVLRSREGCRRLVGYLLVSRRVRRVAGPGLEIVMPTGIGRDELRKLAGQGAQLVEVLPAGDYEWAHLPGAVNVPLKELDAGSGQLDRSRPVIVYCHDWY